MIRGVLNNCGDLSYNLSGDTCWSCQNTQCIGNLQLGAYNGGPTIWGRQSRVTDFGAGKILIAMGAYKRALHSRATGFGAGGVLTRP